MQDIYQITENITSEDDEAAEFRIDVHKGLSNTDKKIPSKYFYDKRGSQIFNQITRHPDYYLTRCELEILYKYKEDFSKLVSHSEINLVELGPGEGIKTNIIINQLINDQRDFLYIPIDISKQYLKSMIHTYRAYEANFKISPIHMDYLKGLAWLGQNSKRKNLVMFLGSSIGNYTFPETEFFVRCLYRALNNDDYVLIGFDLKKDIDVLMRAYNDADGLTRDFNFNLLNRINRHLKANFNLKQFQHYPTYNVQSGAMESYLISLEKQIITIAELNQSYQFNEYEAIHVEYSYKYLMSQVEDLATKHGFEVVNHYLDKNAYLIIS